MPKILKGFFLPSLALAQVSLQEQVAPPVALEFVGFHQWDKSTRRSYGYWKYSGKEVAGEELKKVLGSLICFKCSKELHTDDCPFAKLRAELNALKEK